MKHFTEQICYNETERRSVTPCVCASLFLIHRRVDAPAMRFMRSPVLMTTDTLTDYYRRNGCTCGQPPVSPDAEHEAGCNTYSFFDTGQRER